MCIRDSLWAGYQVNANYWDLRGEVASRLKQTNYLKVSQSEKLPSAGVASKISAAYSRYVGGASRRFRAVVGMSILAGYFVAANIVWHQSVEYSKDFFRSIASANASSGQDEFNDPSAVNTVSASEMQEASRDAKLYVSLSLIHI